MFSSNQASYTTRTQTLTDFKPLESWLSPHELKRTGYQATVDGILNNGQEWRVKYQGVFWKARTADQSVYVSLGDRVQVVGRLRNVLIVEPIH